MSFGDIHVYWNTLKVLFLPIFNGYTRSETTFVKDMHMDTGQGQFL